MKVKFALVLISSLFCNSTLTHGAALSSRDSTSFRPPVVAVQKHDHLLWYKPDIVLTGTTYGEFTTTRICPPNTGNIFCSLLGVSMNDSSCMLAQVEITSWFHPNDPYKVVILSRVSKRGGRVMVCDTSKVQAKVSCSIICSN